MGQKGSESAPIAWAPEDFERAILVGRLATKAGPSPIVIRGGVVFDVSKSAPTVADLVERRAFDAPGEEVGPLASIDSKALLAPVDLQCVKAAGVTFAVSALERVIEERARGDSGKAEAIRAALSERIGQDLRSVNPGSAAAANLKQALISDGLWSQYLEVAIGPDAEIFTKAPILSSVGAGADIGVRSDSTWNNPEPEIVILCDSKGETVGASLGNDVNLRCFEGRSALLLGKAKDNNASSAIGPFVRIFDEGFGMDDVRSAVVSLEVKGPEGFTLTGKSSMTEISRDPTDLARAAMSEHQYPDGFALFLGTMFAPIQDRDEPGRGFTHKVGDMVRVSSPKLGVLENRVVTCKDAPPWTFGVRDLYRNLAARGLIQ